MIGFGDGMSNSGCFGNNQDGDVRIHGRLHPMLPQSGRVQISMVGASRPQSTGRGSASATE